MAKTLPVVRLVTLKLIVSLDAVVGVEFLAITVAKPPGPPLLSCRDL